MFYSVPKPTPGASVKGECFHNVFLTMSKGAEGWLACHGICVGHGPIEGQRFVHAWMELEYEGIRVVYDPTTDALLPAAIFYRVGQIEEEGVVRYTREELLALAVRRKHSGPFVRKLWAKGLGKGGK